MIAACIAVVLAFAMQCIAPAQAQAKSYECPRVVLDATLHNDGSLSVTEQRTFDFNGDFTAVWWTFDNLPGAESKIAVDAVALASEDNGGAQEALPEEPFQRAWREAGGPGFASYSVDEDERTVYVFFNMADQEATVTLSLHHFKLRAAV